MRIPINLTPIKFTPIKFTPIKFTPIILSFLLVGVGLPRVVQAAETTAPAKHRKFIFHYDVRLVDLPIGEKVRIWLPIASDNEHQSVKILSIEGPNRATIGVEKKYQNKVAYFEGVTSKSGEMNARVVYSVERSEVRGAHGVPQKLSEEQRALFISPNEKVPTTGKPLDLVKNTELPKEPEMIAKTLYDTVENHMKYDKSRPGYGTGDSVWACDSQFGNCTDFHSLFISLARSQKLPARFVIGFPLPEERGEGKIGGYHCWAYFHSEKNGWQPVDISEADKHPEMKEYYFRNLTENRVAFSTGRDITLTPPQASKPLNFFVYPHVEIDGKQVEKKHIELKFSYLDQ